MEKTLGIVKIGMKKERSGKGEDPGLGNAEDALNTVRFVTISRGLAERACRGLKRSHYLVVSTAPKNTTHSIEHLTVAHKSFHRSSFSTPILWISEQQKVQHTQYLLTFL